jgi:hypothetical protein
VACRACAVATIAYHVASNAFFSALIVANLDGWFG